jgi:hypothetical protein
LNTNLGVGFIPDKVLVREEEVLFYTDTDTDRDLDDYKTGMDVVELQSF